MKNNIKAISVIIGTMIGAGFASGKEVYVFFAQYKIMGLIGAIISSLITAIVIYATLKISKKYKLKSNNEFVDNISKNENVATSIKNIINTFLLASFWIMCAGLCSFFKQEFNIPIFVIATISGCIIYMLLMTNIEGIMKLNTIIVPIMVLAIVYISILNSQTTQILEQNIITNTDAIKAIIKSILYTSYNSILLIPIIVSISKDIKSDRDIKIIAIISSLIIFILLILIYQMLVCAKTDISKIEMPILSLLEKNIWQKVIYGIAIVSAIITSVVSASYGALENIKDKNKYKLSAIVICLLEIPISYIGFGNLVSTLYPIFGVIGIAQIILILKTSNSIAKTIKN